MQLVVIDRRRLVREGLAQLMGQQPDFVVADASPSFQAVARSVDVMIVGEIDGDDRPPRNRAAVVQLTAGMTLADLVERVRRAAAHRGRRNTRTSGMLILTEQISGRQREILRLISAGLTAEEIASSLSVSRSTVEHHKQLLFARVGVQSQSQAVARLVDPSRAVDA